VISPGSVLLPTPEPAKIPTRWPRPQVSNDLLQELANLVR